MPDSTEESINISEVIRSGFSTNSDNQHWNDVERKINKNISLRKEKECSKRRKVGHIDGLCKWEKRPLLERTFVRSRSYFTALLRLWRKGMVAR